MSTTAFDPYHKWLGIPPQEQPPNHYRLIGIALFESDPDVIDTAANKQMSYLHQCATGPHAALSQQLLNELSQARICLLNTQKKAAYDAQLQATIAEEYEVVELEEETNESEEFGAPAVAPMPEIRVSTRRPGNRSRRKSSPLMGIIIVLAILLGGASAYWIVNQVPESPTELTSTGNHTTKHLSQTDSTKKSGTNPPLIPGGTVPNVNSPKGNGPKANIPGGNPPVIPGTNDSNPGNSQNKPPSDPNAMPREISNSLKMKLVLVPAGSFLMGSQPSQAGDDDETPQHSVTITQPFYFGKFEVTQEQYEKLMPKPDYQFIGSDRPAETMTWEQATTFCEKLSKDEGRTYRLPTEAEWEYACRAGSNSKFSFGDDQSQLEKYGWTANTRNSNSMKVGLLEPNAFGLFDMHGNVGEWCSDWHGRDWYQNSPKEDPQGPDEKQLQGDLGKVIRGGSWQSTADNCRCAYRNIANPKEPSGAVGFRVVLELSPEDAKRVGIDGPKTVEPENPDPSVTTPLVATPDPLKDVWKDVRPLLAKRSYTGAAAKLKTATEKSDFSPEDQARLKQATVEIEALQEVEKDVVASLVRSLPGIKIRIGSVGNQTFVRFDKSKQEIITKIGTGGRDRVTSLDKLRISEWQELLLTSPNPRTGSEDLLSWGILHSFDENGDADKGLPIFQKIAASGEDVSLWLKWLEVPAENSSK